MIVRCAFYHSIQTLCIPNRFGLLSGHVLGNSCPLGWPYVLIVFLSVCDFYLFPILVLRVGFGFCSSSCSLLFYYFYLYITVANDVAFGGRKSLIIIMYIVIAHIIFLAFGIIGFILVILKIEHC